MKEKTVGYYLSEFGAWSLGAAMFVFLAQRTLHFLSWTFSEGDSIFAYLGLFSTTAGAMIWALLLKFGAETNQTRAIAWIMLVVDLLGELGLAIADIYLVTSLKGQVSGLTEAELNTAIWLSAGLAALNGVAILAVKMLPKNDHRG